MTPPSYVSVKKEHDTILLSGPGKTEIERWAYAFWLSSYNPKNMIVSLSQYSAYFDASHQDLSNKQTVVAGYIASVEEWAQFEIAWRLALAKFDVPFFKMSEFIGYRKPFDHPAWRIEAFRAKFLKTLTDIIRDWTSASIACRMKQDLFDTYNKTYKLDERFNIFTFCGRDCAAQARKFIREIPSDVPIAFIFDQGDLKPGLLTNEMIGSGLPAPSFKRGRPDPDLDKDDPYHVQLQACDLLAWELRRGENDWDKGFKTMRKSLKALDHKHKIWKQTLECDLKAIIELAKIEKR